MWYLPCGLVSAMWGTRPATRLKSSRLSMTPASEAMASRCSTALVDPPRALTTAMAFSNASRVRMSLGRISLRSRFSTATPLAWAKSSRRLSGAGGDDDPGSAMPRASATAAMVLAVNMPAHDPSLGQAPHSISLSSASSMSPAACAPTASNTLTMSVASPLWSPGRMLPPYTNTLGRLSRADAMSMPGRLLSQPAKVTRASKRSACITVSTLSAMTSRLTSDARMPS